MKAVTTLGKLPWKESCIKGFLYVGSTLAASILQFESTIRSNFAFSAVGCLR